MIRTKPYEKLKFYQDICEIRRFIYEITERFKNSHLRLVSQMRDSARSAKQNIREGYRKGSIGGYIHSIKINQGSLEELSGDSGFLWLYDFKCAVYKLRDRARKDDPSQMKLESLIDTDVDPMR